MGTKLLMSTSFHPQTDGQTEHANRNIGQIFRTLVRPDQKDWVDRVDMTEFAINASVAESTGYAPFELNGGYLPSIIREIRNGEEAHRGVAEFATIALENLVEAHDSFIEARAFQTHYANQGRRTDDPISKGDLVFLSTKNLNLPKARARKLCPKYIGPYEVLHSSPETSTYTLDLPPELKGRRILPTFHISLLKPYHQSDDTLFPRRSRPGPYDFGLPSEREYVVDEILGHRWEGRKLSFEVRWMQGDSTWESYDNCKHLVALDKYLELQGVKHPSSLARTK